MDEAPRPPKDAVAVRAALRADLAMAMKSRRPEVVAALRSAISAIDNAEAVAGDGALPALGSEHVAGAHSGVGAAEAARRELSTDAVHVLLLAQVEERLEAADSYEDQDLLEAANRLRAEAEALRRYLDQ